MLWFKIKGGGEIIKVKGSKGSTIKPTFDQFKGLLLEDSSMNISQERWVRSHATSIISIKIIDYYLFIQENKRKLLWVNG